MIEAPLDGQFGDLDTVRLLLAAKADVNRMDGRFGGPLHHAIKVRRIDIVKVLLQAGADKHAKTGEPDAKSAVEYAHQLASQDPSWVPIRCLVDYHMQVWP